MNSLNCWYVIIPAMFVLCAIVGWKRYDVKCHSLQILMTYTDEIRDAIAIAMSIIAGLLVMMESYWGIVQFSDNHLAVNDSPIWSLIAPVGCGFAVAIVLTLLFILVINIASRLKYKWLTAGIEEIKAERRRKLRQSQQKRRK